MELGLRRAFLQRADRPRPRSLQARPRAHAPSQEQRLSHVGFGIEETSFVLGQPQLHAAFDAFLPAKWTAAAKPIEEAHTPPSSWYNRQEVWEYEKEAVLRRNWLFVGHTGKLKNPGDYFTGTIADESFVVVKGRDNLLQAFHNVCPHRAAPVASGSGCTEIFECPYHGWKFDLSGQFRGAGQLNGIKSFYAEDQKLKPIRIDTWGHFVFLLFNNAENAPSLKESMSAGGAALEDVDMHAPDLVHVHQGVYHLDCNWKCYNDNFLDGCYHCSYAHPGFAQVFDIQKYHNLLYDKVSIQVAPRRKFAFDRVTDGKWNDIIACRMDGDDRDMNFSFIYPNLMANRYAMWMDTLHVIPLGPDKCQVNIDYWVHRSKVNDQQWINSMVAGEHQVQTEDVALCNSVQEGYKSSAFDVGRYAPGPESTIWHFHQLLNKDFFST